MENEKKNTTSNAETVTISRAEYEALQAKFSAQNEQLKNENAELNAKLKNTTAQLETTTKRLEYKTEELAATLLKNQWLMEQLKLTKKKLFGTSSEQVDQMMMEQFAHLFNEAEGWDASSFVKETKVKSHTRKRQSGSVEDVIPEGTPVEVVEHRLSEEERTCAVCGSEMVEIGKEVRRSLKMKPAQFWVQEDVYYTYACKHCEQETDEANIVKTPKEPVICPGSFASPEAVAHIMTQKFVMYSPLYRLEQEFGRQGLKLSRQTMSNWMGNVSDTWLWPIYDVLHRKLCQEKVLHGDETTLQVLREAGKASTSKSYMWLYRTSGCAEHPIVLYEYQPNRKAENAEKFLEGFSGWLHADGYQGYHRLPERIQVVGCWAHARRKFDEALNALDKDARKGSLAATGECYCSRLFQLEEAFAELPPEERYDKRLEQEKPVLDALLAWANATSGKVAPKSALGKALHYLLEQWPYLIRYLEDGQLELSNNRAERSIKPFVMGRKNWLFANTPGGAQSSAVIYSLIETAKESGLDPYRYLLWVLESAPAMAQTDENWAEKLIPACAPDICKVS
jgi:transposase